MKSNLPFRTHFKNAIGFKLKTAFQIILVFGIYHLVRDVLQIIGIENVFSQVAKRQHEWAKIFGSYQEYLSLPLDLIMIVGSIIILRRRSSGNLGIIVFLSIIILVLMWLGK